MFHRGEETLGTLANLVRAFEKRTTSYLSQEKATDVELYELTKDQPKVKATPEWVEETPLVALLKTVSEQLQQHSHYLARQKGRPKVKPYPRPKTAEQLWAAKKAVEDFEHINSVLKFIPDEQFRNSQRKE